MQIRIPLEFGTSTPGTKYCFLLSLVPFEKKTVSFLCRIPKLQQSVPPELYPWIPVAYIPISSKVASLALELLCKCYSVCALMAEDMGKIDKSELCVNTSGYAAHDGVSKQIMYCGINDDTSVIASVSELTSIHRAVEGVSMAWWHHETLKLGQIELLMADVTLKAFYLKKMSQFRQKYPGTSFAPSIKLWISTFTHSEDHQWHINYCFELRSTLSGFSNPLTCFVTASFLLHNRPIVYR